MTDTKPEEKAQDLEKRVRSFNEEFMPLLKKYKLGLGAQSFLMPDGRIGAKPSLFDDQSEEKVEPVDDTDTKEHSITTA